MTDLALVIVMEYASGGPLEERIATSGPLAEEEAKKFYKQLVDGMGYCHDQVCDADCCLTSSHACGQARLQSIVKSCLLYQMLCSHVLQDFVASELTS